MVDAKELKLPKIDQTLTAPRIKGFRGTVCFGLARLFLNSPLRRFGFRCEANVRFENPETYQADRVEQIDEFQSLFSGFPAFEGKTVLEIGCNSGYLIDAFLRSGHFTAIGADIDEVALRNGRDALGDRAQFVQSTPVSIPLPDAGVDLIYTIDTVEHLSQPREIFTEAYRILRPGGIFLVHFCPWLGPYGAHLEDIIPFPWPQAFFSMDTLLDVAATIYDSPGYEPVWYYIDPETKKKGPNPFLDKVQWDEYLNRMTVGKFSRMLKELPFEVIHIENIGFGGKMFPLARYLAWLSRIPGPDEYFTKAIFCALKKPGNTEQTL